MIIWIDGTYGVGKTSVVMEIQKKIKEERFEVLESDCFFLDMLRNNPLIGGGTIPQNNIKFIEYFRNKIEEKMKNSHKDLIIVMSLTQIECKELLFDYFIKKDASMKHFILTANTETIKLRIKSNKDKDRDIELANNYLESNMTFLSNNYKDAIIINTENKNIAKVAEEIIELI